MRLIRERLKLIGEQGHASLTVNNMIFSQHLIAFWFSLVLVQVFHYKSTTTSTRIFFPFLLLLEVDPQL